MRHSFVAPDTCDIPLSPLTPLSLLTHFQSFIPEPPLPNLIAIMEEYLRAYVNCLQDDWARYLALAEFAANNRVSATTGTSPSYTNLGLDLQVDFELDIWVDKLQQVRA